MNKLYLIDPSISINVNEWKEKIDIFLSKKLIV